MLGLTSAPQKPKSNYLRTSSLQALINLRLGTPGPLPPPVAGFEKTLDAQQQIILSQVSSASAVGTADQVREQVEAFIAQTGADELVIVGQIFDHAERIRSYEIAMEACKGL